MRRYAMVAVLIFLTGAVLIRTVNADPPTYGPDGIIVTVASASEIDLTWNGVNATPLVTGYKIERESPVGGGFTTIVANTGTSLASYNDKNLQPHTTYNYRITAINSDGLGLPSANAAIGTTLGTSAYVPPPDAPQNIVVTPTSGTTLSLSWSAPPSNQNTTGYNIERGVGGGFTLIAQNVKGTNFSDSGLSPGGAYDYHVIAVNASGPGNPSNTVYVTMPQTPSAPGNVRAIAGNGQATVGWSQALAVSGGVTQYAVSGTPAGYATVASSVLSVTITGLTNGTPYTFYVSAANLAGIGPAIASNSVTPATSSLSQAPMPPPYLSSGSSGGAASSSSANFHFVSTLQFGSRGEAVAALQNYLAAKKFYVGPVTGYFGALTKAAVKLYQRAHGIAQVGSVGPLTRILLNAGL